MSKKNNRKNNRKKINDDTYWWCDFACIIFCLSYTLIWMNVRNNTIITSTLTSRMGARFCKPRDFETWEPIHVVQSRRKMRQETRLRLLQRKAVLKLHLAPSISLHLTFNIWNMLSNLSRKPCVTFKSAWITGFGVPTINQLKAKMIPATLARLYIFLLTPMTSCPPALTTQILTRYNESIELRLSFLCCWI